MPSVSLLQGTGTFTAGAPEPHSSDSGVAVILAALLCAVIFVVGLVLVARCLWLRRHSAAAPTTPSPNKGLKEEALQSLPIVPFSEAASAGAECPICLAQFEEGEEMRVLPECGHAFHVRCVDAWLRSHSSCPLCRRELAVASAA